MIKATLLLLGRRRLAIAGSLVATCFIVTRLPFFIHYRLPDIAVDYWSYFDVVQQARHGQWPKLYLRTPGYPLFLAIVFIFSQSAIAVVTAQCLTTLAASLTTLACFARINRRLAYPAAFALIGFTASMHSVYFDTALMSESLYCSLLMLSFGLLALAIMRTGFKVCIAVSVVIAATMLTRPAGFFLFGIFGLALTWLAIQRRPRREVLAFCLPLATIMLAACVYNRLTIGSFTVTPFGAVNLLGAVATYIEEDPSAPESLNNAVRAIQASVTPEDRAIIATSRDPAALSGVFVKYYDAAIYTHMGKVSIPYMELTDLYKQIGRLSIQRHPGLYLKLAAANYYYFYRHGLLNRNHDDYFYDHLPVRYARQSVEQPHIWRDSERITINSTWTRRIHERFNAIHEAVFWNPIWLLSALALLLIAVWKIVRSRAKDAGAIVVALCVLSLIGAGLVVALVQMPMTRYATTVLFLTYLAPLYLYVLVQRSCLTDK
jgi:hypothetical protein